LTCIPRKYNAAAVSGQAGRATRRRSVWHASTEDFDTLDNPNARGRLLQPAVGESRPGYALIPGGSIQGAHPERSAVYIGGPLRQFASFIGPSTGTSASPSSSASAPRAGSQCDRTPSPMTLQADFPALAATRRRTFRGCGHFHLACNMWTHNFRHRLCRNWLRQVQARSAPKPTDPRPPRAVPKIPWAQRGPPFNCRTPAERLLVRAADRRQRLVARRAPALDRIPILLPGGCGATSS